MKEYTKLTMDAPLLNRQIEVYIWTPKSYGDQQNRYPVLYMHDGHNLFDPEESTFGKVWNVHKVFEQNKDIPECIVVGINAPQGQGGLERFIEYTPYNVVGKDKEFVDRYLPMIKGKQLNGKGHNNLQTIVDVVKPYIDKNYRSLSDQSNTLISGSSMGGILTSYAALHFNHTFSKFLAFSNAYFYNGSVLIDDIKNSDLSLVDKLYMDCGTNEISITDNTQQVYLDFNRKAYDNYKSMLGDKVLYVEAEGGIHSEECWEERLPNALRFVFDIK